MQQLVTASEIRDMDRMTIEAGMPGLLLMEHAGIAAAGRAFEILEDCGGERVAVFCGKGNNGGDGYTAARILAQSGLQVTVYLTCAPEQLQGDAASQFSAMKVQNVSVIQLGSPSDFDLIQSADLIVDALLGTGVKGEVTGFFAELIDRINQSEVPVLSVDIPSGLQCDTGDFEGACVEADATVTFARLKRGLVLTPGRELAGVIDVADIGIPEHIAAAVHSAAWMIDSGDCRDRLPVRPVSGHKGDFGKVAVIAGSRGMTGAAVLASTAALRAGCGLVKLACPAGLNAVFESMMPEVITVPLPETADGSLSPAAEKEIGSLMQWADVLAVGPGLSGNAETRELIHWIVNACRLPMVLDADGLNAYTGRSGLLNGSDRPLILTPHPGELAGLTGMDISDILRDPAGTAIHWAQKMNCVLVLKSAPACIGLPDGRVFVNSTGNSGMGTGGTGDVLTGMTAGLLAQGASAADAALCAVYSHGLAGDLAAETVSERALTAGDLMRHIGAAFRQIEADA